MLCALPIAITVKHLGPTRISRKHQITIPVAALRAAGLEVGDRLRVVGASPGRVALERLDDLIAEYAGALTGRISRGESEALDAEWERRLSIREC